MVHPVLSGGYVLDGGALCMELMTPQVVRHALELMKLTDSTPENLFFLTSGSLVFGSVVDLFGSARLRIILVTWIRIK